MNNIVQAIYNTIEEINRQLPEGQRMTASADTVIVGEGGTLDSLGVINFLVALEARVSEETGVNVTLLDESLISDLNGPLKTISSLEDYIQGKL